MPKLYIALKKVYHFCIWPINLTKKFKYKYLNFVFCNFKPLFFKRIKFFGKLPACQQKTIITGLGTVEIGDNCTLGYKLGGFHRGGSIELQARYKNSHIKIGHNIATNNNISICAANLIEIGDHTLIGQYVTILDHEAHGINPDKRREIGTIGKVVIGKNVWIGSNVTLLKNSEVGDNTIIATGAVVSGIFPANVIIGGVPAKIIKSL